MAQHGIEYMLPVHLNQLWRRCFPQSLDGSHLDIRFDLSVERLALSSLTSVSNPGNPGALWLHGCMLEEPSSMWLSMGTALSSDDPARKSQH